MGQQVNIGENEGLDSEGNTGDVSYIPQEGTPENQDERSDIQRAQDGDILELDGPDGEIFVNPNTVYKPKAEEVKEEVKEEKKEEAAPKPKEEEPPPKKEEEKKEELTPKKAPASAPDPVQKRINKAVREKYEAERKAQALEDENKKLRLMVEDAKKQELTNQKPNEDEFETHDDYIVALGRWAAKMEMSEQKVVTTKEAPKKTVQDEDPRDRVINLGQETYGDFIEKVSSIPLTKETFEAIQDSDHAHEVLYYLGDHPEKALQISKLTSQVAIARELGRIEAQFTEEIPEVFTPKPGDDSELLEKEKKKMEQEKKPTSAPVPIKPLGGGGSVAKKKEDMTIAEYYESRGFTRDGMKKSRIIRS